MISRSSSATNIMKFTTYSGLPREAADAGLQFCVAMPTGQVSCWQSRCIMQPIGQQRHGGEAELLGTEQGRPWPRRGRHMSLPSVSTTTRLRKPLRKSVCWVSARPISNGMPAW